MRVRVSESERANGLSSGSCSYSCSYPYLDSDVGVGLGTDSALVLYFVCVS